MCRIAGQIAPDIDLQQIVRNVKKMCHVLQHGGPDDEGIFSDDEERIVFGHRRLSIIDLSANGHQPMADTEQKVWITFNGEIYNYPELKHDLLALGARFKSTSDTEVIIQAYLHWGEASFGKLRGIFAFALYDKVKLVTYLVRDISGIKPLYYCAANGQLSFSSEVKAIKEAGIATKADPNWKVRFLAFGHIPEPYTTLQNVFSLPKGHYLCWDNKNGAYKTAKYNGHVHHECITDEEQARELIRDTFTASIRRQLIDDAQIGVFLSGGIDSSLITLLAAREKNTQLKTISIFFNEKDYDERHYQDIVFDRIEGEKFTHLVNQKDFEISFPQIMKDMDMPTTDGINTWFISKYAHEDGLKAVLSGLGADELYGGYPSFSRIQNLKYLKKIPSSLLSVAMAVLPGKYKKLQYMAYDHPLADYLSLRGMFTLADIAAIFDLSVRDAAEILFEDMLHVPDHRYDEEYAGWMESNLYMQNQLLRDTDVMSMSHALEVRVPFLDEDFIRATMSISPEIRFDKTQGKKLLIDSFKDILPESVWNRPKMGFTFPLQQWMRQLPEISDPNLYSGKTVQNVIKEFKNNNVHWSKAFALYQLKQHA
jgi:asparagine synthase (glutamine-hydrolysing)